MNAPIATIAPELLLELASIESRIGDTELAFDQLAELLDDSNTSGGALMRVISRHLHDISMDLDMVLQALGEPDHGGQPPGANDTA